MEWLVRYWGIFCEFTRGLGPYLLMELVLPGGTLFALLLFLYRRKIGRSDRAIAL